MKITVIFLMLSMFLCTACPILQGVYTIDVVLEEDSAIIFSSGARIRFDIYAYDTAVADVPASLVKQEYLPIASIPEHFSLYYDTYFNKYVEYSSGNGDFGYSLAYVIDANGDDVVNDSDYVMDYNRNPPVFSGQGLRDLSGTYYVRPALELTNTNLIF